MQHRLQIRVIEITLKSIPSTIYNNLPNTEQTLSNFILDKFRRKQKYDSLDTRYLQ